MPGYVKQAVIGAVLFITVLLAGAAIASEGDTIRDEHRVAAQAYLDSFRDGMLITGKLIHNECEGSFEAYYTERTWVMRQAFGELTSRSFASEDGVWLGSNHSLPYKMSPEDHPANSVVNLLGSGKYLEGPYWEQFTYTGESAMGYEFAFTPKDLPPVKLVINSDPEEPDYLQVIGIEVPFAPDDPESMIYRATYYYNVNDDGLLEVARETGRDIDWNGDTINFIEFIAEEITYIDDAPEELAFERERVPVGGMPKIEGTVAVPISMYNGYIVLPVTFANGERARFMLDTGAETTLMTPKTAELSDLATSMNIDVYGHGTRSRVELGLLKGATITAEDDSTVELPDIRATIIPEINIEVIHALEFNGTGGIIGLSLLHKYVVTFDLTHNQLLLNVPGEFDVASIGEPDHVFDLDVEDLIYCEGTLSGIPGEWVMDTGLQAVSLAVLEETVGLHDLELEKIGEHTSTVVGGERRFDWVMVPEFTMGDLESGYLTASMTSDDRGTLSGRGLLGFVGISFFYGALVTIDVFEQKMYVRFLSDEELEAAAEEQQIDLDELPDLGDFVAQGAAEDEDDEPAEDTTLPVDIG